MDALTTAQNLFLELIQKLPPPVQSVLLSSTTRNVLAVVLAFSLLRTFNRVLSSFVLNNWTSDKYDWSREVVLLTGGCSGIGQHVAHSLASKGVKVIVADIQEPATPLRASSLFLLDCNAELTRVKQKTHTSTNATSHPQPTSNKLALSFALTTAIQRCSSTTPVSAKKAPSSISPRA